MSHHPAMLSYALLWIGRRWLEIRKRALCLVHKKVRGYHALGKDEPGKAAAFKGSGKLSHSRSVAAESKPVAGQGFGVGFFVLSKGFLRIEALKEGQQAYRHRI